MADVRLPTLERIGPQAPQSSGQMPTNVPENAHATAAVTEAIGTAGNQIADYQAKVEEHADEMTSQQAANDYSVLVRKDLAETRKYQGDPTSRYAQLDDNKKQYRDAVLAKYPNVSTRAKQLITEKLTHADFDLNDRQATQHGLQWELYNQQVGKDTTYLNKQTMLDKATTVDINPAKVDEFGLLITKMNNDIITNFGPGAYITDSKGETKLNPEVRARMLRASSDALGDTIRTLNTAGKTDASKTIMDKYGEFIDLDTMSKLSGEHKASVIEKQAIALANQVQADPKYGGDPVLQLKALVVGKNDSEDMGVIKQKARAVLNSDIAGMKNAQESSDSMRVNDTTIFLKGGINRKDKDGNILPPKWSDINALRADKEFQARTKGLKQKDIDVLEAQYQNPKISDSEAVNKFHDLIMNQKLRGMTPGELQRNLVNIGPERKAFEKKWEDANTETGADESKRDSFLYKELKEQMSAAELIPVSIAADDNDSQALYVGARNDLMDYSNTLPPKASQDELRKFVQGKVAAMVQGKKFTGANGAKKKLNTDPRQDVIDQIKNKLTKLTPAREEELKIQFHQKKGHVFGTDQNDDMAKFRIEIGDK